MIDVCKQSEDQRRIVYQNWLYEFHSRIIATDIRKKKKKVSLLLECELWRKVNIQ